MDIYKKLWWRILCIVLMFYTIIGGFLIDVPRLPILNETIRNQFFHVPMWFSMLILLTGSVIFSIKYLRSSNIDDDRNASAFASVGIILGILGMVTGSVWAKFTWGAWWVNDPKLNSALIALNIYLAYTVLRYSMDDEQQRAKISAVYNIFAFATLIPLLFILPRMTDSLHPGNGGNPGFNIYDLDNRLRLIFYPAVVGWTLLGVWLVSINVRFKLIKNTIYEALSN